MKLEVKENNTNNRKKRSETIFIINRVYTEDSDNSLEDLVEKTAINDLEVGNDEIVTKKIENA
ncbi:TPA: hypothetical protein ACGY2Z_002926 [Listeria monocytogenes]